MSKIQSKKNNTWAYIKGVLIALQLAADVCFIHMLNKEKKELDRAQTDNRIRENEAKAEKQKEVDTTKTHNDIDAGHAATKDAIELHNAKTHDEIEKNHEKTDDNIKYDNAHTGNLIRMEKARSDREKCKTEEGQKRSKDRLKAEEKRTAILVKRKERLSNVPTTKPCYNYNQTHPFAKSSFHAFYNWYYLTFGFLQDLPLPPMLWTLIAGCPFGFDIPAVFTILSVLGAYCFSSLRADFHGTKQPPTIFVIIEGPAGSGKSEFKRIYKMLAARFIEHDKKYSYIPKNAVNGHIVQTLSVEVTKAKYAQRLYWNRGVHTFFYCEEIDTAKSLLRKNGLGDEYIRKAFDNGSFDYDTCSAGKYTGSYSIFTNLVLTGTPQTVGDFFDGNVENGEASRFICCDIPDAKFDYFSYSEPLSNELIKILDELDSFHDHYTFTTDTDGNEVPCQETLIDLSYAQSALEDWKREQGERYKKDNQHARPDQYKRISTIAFRCAMVIHALWGFPKDKETQQKVVTLTKYLANYIMERYIYKFGHIHNIQSQFASQKVSERGIYKEVPEDVVADWIRRNKVLGADGKPIEGYGTFAKEWNDSHPNNPISKDTVKRRMNRYTKSHPEK